MAEEKNFENRIKSFLTEQGCWFVKYWSGGVPTKQGVKKFTKDGVPDLLVCCKGYFIGVEVKATHGTPSPLQLYNLKKIDEAGGFGILLYPKDFELFKQFILALQTSEVSRYNVLYLTLKGVWSDG